MKDLCINIQINNPKRDISDESNIYHAHLIFDEPVSEITLKIYHDGSYESQRDIKHEVNHATFCKNIKFIRNSKSLKDTRAIEDIDFSESWVMRSKDSSEFHDAGGQYVIFNLSSIRIVYPPIREYQNTESGKSQFYLNRAASKLIEPLYFYNRFGTSNAKNSWIAVNRKDEFFQFGEVEIRLRYHFYSKGNRLDDTEIIHKRPLLDIQYEGLAESQVHNYKKLIFSVLSLYRNEIIDFDFARISNNKGNVETSKINKEVILSNYIGKLRDTGFSGDFIDMLKQVQPEKILDEVDFFSKFCHRYLLGQKLFGESKFMIFYNLLEQIRNKYISPEKLKQEYEFVRGKKKTNTIIKDKLKEISEAVIPEQKEQFKAEVIRHDRTIRLLPMRNQFKELFDEFEISLTELELDFENLGDIRNKIYHGYPIDNEEDMNFLEEANQELPVLAGKLLLKMVGVETEVEEEYFMDI